MDIGRLYSHVFCGNLSADAILDMGIELLMKTNAYEFQTIGRNSISGVACFFHSFALGWTVGCAVEP